VSVLDGGESVVMMTYCRFRGLKRPLVADICVPSKIPHASANCWPLLVLAGSSETHNSGKGAFQEMDAIAMLTPHAKLALRPPGPEFIPPFIRDAYRATMFGRPGPALVDLPANLILGHFDVERKKLAPLAEAPKSVAPERNVVEAVRLLKSAKAPLVVLGKGAAYGRAEGPIRELIERYVCRVSILRVV
jgi:2-hydroxyacyl-CoA lyase 1